MINTSSLKPIAVIVRLYVAIVAATLLALAIMTLAAPHLATNHAWDHAIIVAAFAVLLPLRLRAAQAGRRSGLRAVGLISATLFVVNVVEALIPGFVPVWMRLQMLAVAALMAVIVLLVARAAVASDRHDRRPAPARH
jgi:hypothetical protein